MIFYQEPHATLYQGDAKEVLEYLPPESVDCCITSPPYWGLRDYKANGQLGLEKTPEEYVAKMAQVFREVRRVLKKEGTCWLNLGDSYSGSMSTDKAIVNMESLSGKSGGQTIGYRKEPRGVVNGLKPKDLVGIPWRVAFALQADGWWLRQDIIWSKPNPMPESVTDRCTKSHEYIFLLSKSAKYYYDHQAILEPIAESTIGRGPVDFGGAKGRNYKEGIDVSDPNYRAGSEQWGRTYDYQKSSRKMNGDNCKIGGNGTGLQGHSGNYDAEGNLLGNPLGRNKRSVWEITTKPYKEAHFATFPPDLIQPMVMAGTSAKGVCPDCGKAWERVTESESSTSWELRKQNGATGGCKDRGANQQQGKGISHDLYTATKTLGWQPTCKCGKEPVQAIVLDPFAGSGTTLQVAKGLNRKAIGIEIKPEYCKLCVERLQEIPIPMELGV